jgi:hypothetical protein
MDVSNSRIVRMKENRVERQMKRPLTALFAYQLLMPFALVLVIAACACTSKPRTARSASSSGNTSVSAANNSPDPGIDLNCVEDHIQKPPEAFHYSYNQESSNPVHEEADITPQTIDGNRGIGNFARAFHGQRSDAESWQGAWSNLMGISGMASSIAIVNHSSATVRETPELMNGYDTVRYSIDTARGNSAELGLYRSVLGNGGFEKGAAWVTPQGCPVKLVLDSEMHLNDGSVDKVHYEENMLRK